MSAREWQPGDVAVATRDDGTESRAIMRHDGTWRVVDACVNNPLRAFRPLVVVDPEEIVHPEALVSVLRDRGWLTIAAAIEEAITPPKPNEPTGYAAVVVDAKDVRWTKYDPRPDETCRWISELGEESAWSEIAAVRVLREGVSA